ncbi:hypothetical protein HIM_05161 [Hirsutella minnesotensis 3608]|uniref:F-box domain-containing protein n=1 Tax=Hirsutella minnesotensis 3608 TaxID=1043627 RepID=A0A0F7ZPG6_9HYPO|nr:hypothetical protein HIM_05161 [Hirsutella minnesotensis 3608]
MPRRQVKSPTHRVSAATHTSRSLTTTTPPNSAHPSTHVSEVESKDDINYVSIASLTLDTPLIPLKSTKKRVPTNPFPFLALPSELRVKVYEHYFDDGNYDTLDLGPGNYKRIHKLLGLMRVCKLIRSEATHVYYSSRTFRIFPTYPGKYFKSKKPLLARLKAHQRQCLTSLELRLGPGWNAPPKGWVVNEGLGLEDCINVTRLIVFVECDPGDGFFKGFRRSEGFYEGFSRDLLAGVMDRLPHLRTVEFDAWSGVKKTGGMMHGLLDVVGKSGLMIRWGPERGWTDAEGDPPGTTPSLEFVEGMTIHGYAPDVIAAA